MFFELTVHVFESEDNVKRISLYSNHNHQIQLIFFNSTMSWNEFSTMKYRIGFLVLMPLWILSVICVSYF